MTYGDSEISAKYDIKIQGKAVAGEFLLENQYSTKIIEKVNCLDGFIKVSGGCNVEKDGDKCKFSWPRISSISLEEHGIFQQNLK